MRKTFQYRAIISKATEANALDWLHKCRILYNLALEQRILLYKQHKICISGYSQCNELTELKKQFPEFTVVGSQCLQDVIERLDKGFKAFFRRLKTGTGKAGFPRFRSAGRYDSFTLKQTGWKLEGRYLYIRNVGRFKLFLSRPVEGEIKTVTIRKTPTDKWFASFSCDKVPAKEFPETDKVVGIDVGIQSFLVDSDSRFVENPQFFRNSEKILRRRQRRLARRKKGSNGRKEARLLVARAHEKVTNQRRDFLHKIANNYINRYKVISVEDLNIQGMVKNRHLSKSIADASWGMFFDILTAKAEEAGRQVIKVRPNGTSQVCSRCGERVPKKLSVRVHECPFCGLILGRDENASRNILALGQSVQALTSALAGVV